MDDVENDNTSHDPMGDCLARNQDNVSEWGNMSTHSVVSVS
jgi:hypothetical protein